jgi:hypothetical protein
MKTRDVLIVLFIFLVCSKMVKAETTLYTDSKGNSIGSSFQMGDMTFYRDSQGNSVGSSFSMGNYTSYNKADGTNIGSSVSMPTNNQRNNQQPQPQVFFNGAKQR